MAQGTARIAHGTRLETRTWRQTAKRGAALTSCVRRLRAAASYAPLHCTSTSSRWRRELVVVVVVVAAPLRAAPHSSSSSASSASSCLHLHMPNLHRLICLVVVTRRASAPLGAARISIILASHQCSRITASGRLSLRTAAGGDCSHCASATRINHATLCHSSSD